MDGKANFDEENQWNDLEPERGVEMITAPNVEPQRMFAPTGIIEPTLLNSKRIKIRVTDGVEKKGGFL